MTRHKFLAIQNKPVQPQLLGAVKDFQCNDADNWFAPVLPSLAQWKHLSGSVPITSSLLIMSRASPANEGHQEAQALTKKCIICYFKLLYFLIENQFELSKIHFNCMLLLSPFMKFFFSVMRSTELNLFIICLEKPKFSPFPSMPL